MNTEQKTIIRKVDLFTCPSDILALDEDKDRSFDNLTLSKDQSSKKYETDFVGDMAFSNSSQRAFN